MAQCKQCGQPMDWGHGDDGRWVPLEPVATHDDLDRTYVDEEGQLRADHRDRHPHGRSVNVTRLSKKVKAKQAKAEEPKRSRLAQAAKLVKGTG